MASVFFYISGHGFGHASRQIEIVNALAAREPNLEIVIRTSAPRWLFDRTARAPLTFVEGECDTGVVQIDSLHLDERETIERAAAFHRTMHERSRHERSRLAARDARLVVSDAPALGCAAAAAAHVPSVVVTNFTWDWIYEGYPEALAAAPDLVPAIQHAYRQAHAAWRLPMHGGFAAFDSIADVPFVARHARHPPAAVRHAFALPPDRVLVLSSFGGYGVGGLDVTRLDCLDRYGVVLTHRDATDRLPPVAEGVYQVSEADLYGKGFRYEDLVAAVDVVATKPGYGIIAECIANDTAILYTSRGRFVEYDVLVAEMPRYLRCGFIDHQQLFAGHWADALDAVLAAPPPAETPRTDGAEVVASMILGRSEL